MYRLRALCKGAGFGNGNDHLQNIEIELLHKIQKN